VSDGLEHKSWMLFANGDARIWQEFISRQIPRLYEMFMNRWPNPTLSEELVQKTIFDAVRGLESYDTSKGSPEEWIYGIARNNFRLEIRKRASRPAPNGDITSYLEAIDNRPLPDEVIERQETAALVRSALNKLESKERAVLMAKYIEGLLTNEIARQMEITEKAVQNLLYRAKLSFREALNHLTSGHNEGKNNESK